MLNHCGNTANRMRMSTWIVCDNISTILYSVMDSIATWCVQYRFIPHLFLPLFPPSSTAFLSKLPLGEYIFYPVSTPPIISTAKIIS